MRVFISGIAGFLGSHLADQFLQDGHEVVGCDSLIGGELDNVPSDAEFYQYDCCYRNSMLKITKIVISYIILLPQHTKVFQFFHLT